MSSAKHRATLTRFILWGPGGLGMQPEEDAGDPKARQELENNA